MSVANLLFHCTLNQRLVYSEANYDCNLKPTYAKGTRERAALQAAVESLKKAGAYSLTGKLSTQVIYYSNLATKYAEHR